MEAIFDKVRDTAANHKLTIPNFDGLRVWRSFKEKCPVVEIEDASFISLPLTSQDRQFYEKEYLDSEHGNENKHFAAQLLRIPSVSTKVYLHKLLQIAYNVGQLIGCGQLYEDPELCRIFKEYSMDRASTYVSTLGLNSVPPDTIRKIQEIL